MAAEIDPGWVPCDRAYCRRCIEQKQLREEAAAADTNAHDEGGRDDDGGRDAGEVLRAQQEAVAARPARPRKESRKALRKRIRELEEQRDTADRVALAAAEGQTAAERQRERVHSALANADFMYVGPDRTYGDRVRAASAGVVLLEDVEIEEAGAEVELPDAITMWSAVAIERPPLHIAWARIRSATTGPNHLGAALERAIRRRRAGG